MEDALKLKLVELAERQLPDVEGMLERWRSDVIELLNQIVEWLRDLEADNLLTLQRSTTRVNESACGEYETERLSIQLHHLDIRIEPSGRWVLGCDGRVDILSTRSPRSYMLLRFEAPDGRGTWELRDPRRKYDKGVPLTSETLRHVLLRMIEG